MPELLATYWPYLLVAFVIGLGVAWFAFAANRKTSITRDAGTPKDVLDEGAERASRNEALIKAAPAAVKESEAPIPSEPIAASTAEASGDDLTRIKGLGPKIAVILKEQGVTSFAQIAAWSDSDIERIDALLGRFQGRIVRDSWVDQAKILTKGDDTEFSKRFGNS